MKKLFLSFTLILSISSASGATSGQVNIFEMKHKLESQARHVLALTKEINHVESNLSVSNKKYAKLAEDRQKLEEGLLIAKKNADIDSTNLKKNYQETKNILMGVLINKMEKEETASNLLSKKILVENLQKRLGELDSLIKSNQEMQTEVDRISTRLQDSLAIEKELAAIMHDLDVRKKDLQATLHIENQKKETALLEFNELKNKNAMTRAMILKEQKRKELAPQQITEEIKIPSAAQIGDGQFFSPIAVHQDLEYQKKGVTFTFQGKNEIRATKSGKIVYTGALANYGNVIMIDHGKEMRSVILGQFDYIVKNGDIVKDAELIGYTKTRNASSLGDGKIYFEVRKNNLAQNTYLLLDKKSLASNSSK